jgi:hypothetical protein
MTTPANARAPGWAGICDHFPIGGMRRLGLLLSAVAAGAAGVLTAVALSATPAPAPSTLPANGSLTAGQRIQSPDGHYSLAMASDGNLVESVSGGRGLWSTGTSRYPGAHALMQVNGNLVLYDTAGSAVWSSNSHPATGCPRLVLQDDGNLVIYTATAIWSAASRDDHLLSGDVLEPGWSVFSIDPEAYRLTMQTDGNLVLYDAAGHPLWNSRTERHPGAYASMQTDGNLVVYSSTNHVLWSSATNGNPGAHLTVIGDGNVDIISGSTVLWRSGTYHKGSGGSVAPQAPPPVACPAPVTPTPPTTTTVTVPTVVTAPVATPLPQPPPRPRALRIKLTIKWTWNRATTRLSRTWVGSFPGRTRLEIRCRGRGCPPKHTIAATGHRGLHRLLRGLSGKRYRAGDKLLITLQAPGYRAERAEVDIVWGHKPKIKLVR